MRTRDRVLFVAVGAILATGLGLSSATAAVFYGGIEKYGSWARVSHVGVAYPGSSFDIVYNKDTANDSQFTSTGWKYGSSVGTTVVNKGGYGVTKNIIATYHPTKVTAIRACRSRTALPMICSDYLTVSYSRH